MHSSPNPTPAYPQQTSSSLDDTLFSLGITGGVLAFIVTVSVLIAIAYAIRLWMVQTATFKIQRDLREIRDWMAEQSHLTPDPEPLLDQDQVIAQTAESEPVEVIERKKIALSKPSKSFVWIICATVAIFLMLLITIQTLG